MLLHADGAEAAYTTQHSIVLHSIAQHILAWHNITQRRSIAQDAIVGHGDGRRQPQLIVLIEESPTAIAFLSSSDNDDDDNGDDNAGNDHGNDNDDNDDDDDDDDDDDNEYD